MPHPERRYRRPLWMLAALISVAAPACKPAMEKQGAVADAHHRLSVMALNIAEVMKATEVQTARLAGGIAGQYPKLAENAKAVDPSGYRLEANGVLHRPDAVKLDRPAVFVSGVVKVDEGIQETVRGTEVIDADLMRILKENPAVVQAYYNDKNSYNRIYPPFEVLTQYPPGMEIPSYNFYYQADAGHNPQRKVVWVKDAYVDPAGRGWMISCIAPVYRNDNLEGVCGLDITVESIVRNFDFEGTNKMCLLASADGTVVATGETLIQILRLPALKNHRYVDTVRSDTFRSEDYNMLKSRSLAIRAMAATLLIHGKQSATLDLDEENWLVHAVPVPELNWRLMEFVQRK